MFSSGRQACGATKSHPAGPIHLHPSPTISSMKWKLDIFGYRLQPGNGFSDNPVHVRPGSKRIRKFKHNLAIRLTLAPKSAAKEVGMLYWARWFASQRAWTKVPGHSVEISLGITETYIDDFLNNIPMGLKRFNYPPKTTSKGFTAS